MPRKHKISIPDIYVSTDNLVLCKDWNKNNSFFDKCIITIGAQNWERNK
jgi:hypothetical protein